MTSDLFSKFGRVIIWPILIVNGTTLLRTSHLSVPSEVEIATLQQDISSLCQWSRNWQMVFNVKKCKVLHVGHNNVHYGYSMNGEV